jgi:hypothetical protein
MAFDLFLWPLKLDENWFMPGGSGVDAAVAHRLATDFHQALEDGRIVSYIAIKEAELRQLPIEECETCSGTGIRSDAIGQKYGMTERVIGLQTQSGTDHPRYGEVGWCNGCGGEGYRKPRRYPVVLADVAEFSQFLQVCGASQSGSHALRVPLIARAKSPARRCHPSAPDAAGPWAQKSNRPSSCGCRCPLQAHRHRYWRQGPWGSPPCRR